MSPSTVIAAIISGCHRRMISPSQQPRLRLSLFMFIVLLTEWRAMASGAWKGVPLPFPPIHYAVVGGHQCGTSVLWSYARLNQRLAFVGHFRNEHWTHTPGKASLCDNSVEEYLNLVTTQLRSRNRSSELLVGDWGAMALNCLCCPASLRMVNPELKVVVLLRDPVQRVMSAFLAARRLRRHFWNEWTKNFTFADYVTTEIQSVTACLGRARRFSKSSSSGSSGSSSSSSSATVAQQQLLTDGAGPHGWGAGMELGQWMEAQCYAHSHLLGWSAYDVFLANYLAHFPPRQLLVLYASQLAQQPAAAMARLEGFLGAPPARERPDTAAVRITPAVLEGVQECNGVRCVQTPTAQQLVGLAPGEQPPLWRPAAVGAGAGAAATPVDAAAAAASSPFARAVAALAEFYAPHVARLVRWGEEGRISPPPAQWREAYGVGGAR